MDTLAKEAQALNGRIIQWYRQLHQIPEVGLQLPRTRAYLCRALDGMGAEYRLHEGTSGLEVLIQGGAGPTVALRADMDALPIQELTELPFASQNGSMHACGHDSHMAMLLGAAELLLNRRERLGGSVKCIFQPGEEGYGGAKRMLEEGVLENPRVEAVFGLHVTNAIPELRPGAIGLKKGVLMAGSDNFCVTFTGKGGHISDTEHVCNPLYAAARLALAVERLTCELGEEQAVAAVGMVQGGVKSNAVPEQAQVKGSVRTIQQESRDHILRELEAAAGTAAAETGCRWEWELSDSNRVLVNDGATTQCAMEAMGRLFPQEGYTQIISSLMASEDISELFEARRGAYLHLGCGFGDGRELFPLHNPRFQLNEQVLWRGAAAMAACALHWLEKRQ